LKQNLAIVILNWNGKDFLHKFLPTLVKHSGNHEIIVADNCSTDDSISFIKEHFSQIRIIQNTENGGFAKGYNDALKKIEAELYLLINSDIEVTENYLIPLLKIMENDSIAGCQSKVLSYSQKDKFEHAGASGGFLDRNFYPFCRGRILNHIEEDHLQYEEKKEIFWATGACLLIRSKLFHEVGGFDEDFFAHMEEIDLCWRLKRLGYSFYVEPASKVYHVGGGTLPYLSPKKTFLNFRNSLFMITKNYQGLLFCKLFYRMSLDGIAAIMFLLQGNFKHFLAVFNAHVDFYKNISSMLAKRKKFTPNPNLFNSKGLYKGSILWATYFKRISKFSKLNMRLFLS
jgi:GT2 family glycosyltransferase